MPKKLSPEEAQRIVKKFCKPPYDPDEAKLKEAMWVIMKEGGVEAFEWEEPEEEEKKPGAGTLAKEASQSASSAGGGVLEGAGICWSNSKQCPGSWGGWSNSHEFRYIFPS